MAVYKSFSKISWILYIASRYLRTKRKNKTITSSLLSIVGIAVGVLTLISVISVMNGFQAGTIQSILEINSFHLRVSQRDLSLSGTDSEEVLDNSSSLLLPTDSIDVSFADDFSITKSVAAVVPMKEEQSMLVGFYSDPVPALIRGVPANVLELDKSFRETLVITHGTFDLSTERSIVLGAELAASLGVRAGASISLLVMTSEAGRFRPEYVEYVVTGLFRCGYYEYDRSWAFVNIEDDLFREAALFTGIKLRNPAKTAEYIEAFAETPLEKKYSLESWEQYNRAIFGALRVEKNMMMLLIGLIFLVVGGNIFQSLRRSIYERTEDLAIVKVLGASPIQVRFIFVVEGFLIGIIGAAIGTALGILLTVNINEVFELTEIILNGILSFFHVLLSPILGNSQISKISIFSPAYFYIEEIPASVNFAEVCIIVFFALLSTSVASFVASKRVSTILPAEVLHYE